MTTLMLSPLTTIIAVAISCVCARKAADLLGATSMPAAVAFGAVFALLGPDIMSYVIAAGIADLTAETGAGAGAGGAARIEEIADALPSLGFGMARMAFALIGVLAWCGIEAAI